MNTVFLSPFLNKRVLLLQGPVGPFFLRLSQDLTPIAQACFKINFNYADEFFFPNGTRFVQPLDQLEAFLRDFCHEHSIDTVVMFGDCRPIHLIAKQVAQRLGIEVFVFEEGYLRPNHITLEREGVNGYSRIPSQAARYLDERSGADIAPPPVVNVGKTYWHAVVWAILYYIIASIGRSKFPNYQHHRPLTIREGWPWIKSAWRKWYFRHIEQGIESKLTQELSRQYFLVPLQLHNDFQISHHSEFTSNEAFIAYVLTSFAQKAPRDTHIALKQHPFDRGYKDYTGLIQQLTEDLGLQGRVYYIHDQYLPALIDHARGVVVINSTVGLSAVGQNRPVKVCGHSVYNIKHLTIQAPLDEFWHLAEHFVPNSAHVHQYLNFLAHHTQHNGSFYRRIKGINNHELKNGRYNHTGVLWAE